MAKGGWKRKLGWGFGIALALGVALAFTWRSWTPTAVRLVLKTRGVQVKSVQWAGTNSWKFEGVERAQNGLVVRAKTVTMLTPKAWKQALRMGNTNAVYLKINGWRVVLPQQKESATNSIAEKVHALTQGAERALKRCPRAVFLNGTLQNGKREFNFGAVEWKGGELSGDFTWPLLNDPAEFRLKVVEAGKVQLILKQIALEIGSRATAEALPDGARLAGYARWKTNRVDFDMTFPMREDTPKHAVLKSQGLAVPGRFVGMPDVETLNARMRLIITNGQFDFVVGTPDY